MKKRMHITVAVLGFVALAASVASAADWGWDRDAGSKVRGDYGYGAGRSVHTAYAPQYGQYVQPGVAAVPADSFAYRSFSYQPNPATSAFRVGGLARATADATLTVGQQVLGTVTRGQEVQVTDIRGIWVGVQATQGGAAVLGWVRAGDLAPVNAGATR